MTPSKNDFKQAKFIFNQTHPPSLQAISSMGTLEFGIFQREPPLEPIVVVKCFSINEDTISILCPFCKRTKGGPVIHDHTNRERHCGYGDRGRHFSRCGTGNRIIRITDKFYNEFWLFVTASTKGASSLNKVEKVPVPPSPPPLRRKRLHEACSSHRKTDFKEMAINRKAKPTWIVSATDAARPVLAPALALAAPPIPPLVLHHGAVEQEEPDLIDALADAFEAQESVLSVTAGAVATAAAAAAWSAPSPFTLDTLQVENHNGPNLIDLLAESFGYHESPK
jgi:hypothetical protein